MVKKYVTKKVKAIHVTGRGGQYGCEMLGTPHCLDNRTDGGKVVSPTHRPHFTSPETSLLFFLMFQVLLSVRGSVNPGA
jgi:hypothetical protein